MGDHKIFSFSLEGIEAMVNRLDRFENDLDQRLEETLTRLALKVIADAKRLAPNLSGDLETALVIGEVQRSVAGIYIDLGASSEVDDYAVIQHEGFRKTKDGKLVVLNPGEKTLSKGAYNGYMPGKKFLENALKMNEKLILEELSKLLEG